MQIDDRIDLLERYPRLKPLLKSRLFQPVLMLMTLAVFTLAVIAGMFGTPVGSRNFGIIFVWIVWWALLIIILVPAAGRLWCAICPIPAPGEWLQRQGIVRRFMGKPLTLGLRWPRRFKNIWLQNAGFLLIAVFSTVILTRPGVSAWLLLGFVLAAVVLSLLFEKRVFCRYVCPVGGFIGLYSMASPLALRVKDTQVCLDHTTKDCVKGNDLGYGCPWITYPGALTRNTACGLCTECLKTCPQDNITLYWRPAGEDLFVQKEHRLDEAYKAFIMLACALLYSIVLLGPWGWIKGWANMDSLPHWLLYAGGFVAVNVLILPGLFAAASAVSRRFSGDHKSLRALVIDYAYSLVPLGLAAWIAFSLGFVLVNGSYAAAVLSDPFGWGWNLFGTASISWQPIAANILPMLQAGVLTAGLLFALNTAYRIATQNNSDSGRAFRAVVPIAVFLIAVTLSFAGLYMA